MNDYKQLQMLHCLSFVISVSDVHLKSFPYKLVKCCICVCVDAWPDVNQGRPNHNHYTQKLVVYMHRPANEP